MLDGEENSFPVDIPISVKMRPIVGRRESNSVPAPDTNSQSIPSMKFKF